MSSTERPPRRVLGESPPWRISSRRRLYDWREWAEALVPLVVTAPVGLLLWYFGGHQTP